MVYFIRDMENLCLISSALNYTTTDVHFAFVCNTSQVDPNLDLDVVAVSNGQELSFYFMSQTVYGCPTNTSLPTPTPTVSPYPQSEYIFYDPDDSHYGLQFSLYDLNGGPHGIRVPLQIRNVPGERILFYQPFERTECPGVTCDETFSSAWVCLENLSSCYSHGDFDPRLNVTLHDQFNYRNGVDLYHYHQNLTFLNHIICNNLAPFDHFFFQIGAEMYNQNTLVTFLNREMYVRVKLKNLLMDQIVHITLF